MKLAICGDIALWRRPESTIPECLNRATPEVINLLNGADLVIGNIECPFTDNNQPQWRYFRTLKSDRSAGRFLKELNIGIGSLANNHIADYGRQGMADTISVLEDQGISWVGAGWTPEEANRPLIMEKDGKRIGVLALAQPEISAASHLAWGAGVLEDEYALNCMSSLSKDVDISVAYLHYGVEFCEYPTPHQVRLSRGLVVAGAKLVIGHHPHVPQGYEWYKGSFIAYSLGNFIFDMKEGPHRFSRLGLVVQADFQNKSLAGVKVLPVDTRGGVTRTFSAEESLEAERHLTQLCRVISDDKKLNEFYYFTCRNNFELYVRAFFYNVFRKGNWRQARDLILQNYWPQLFELRVDLMRFLFSGKAFEIEKERKNAKRDLKGLLWKWICKISFYLGLPFRNIPGFRER